jgi:leader peptidase (prepilin peptidase) / N-methyltransferase
MAILFLFVFGLVIGSFLNVVIYRTTHDESPMEGRSKCEGCGKKISWYDNIPLVSFFFLRGRCRHCRMEISWQHPVVEFLTGIMFVWWYGIGATFFQLTQSPLSIVQPLFWLVVGVFLLIIFVTDIKYFIIPDYAVFGLILLSLLYRLTLALSGAMQWSDFLLALLTGVGAMVFLGSLWFGTKGKGMGFGDVKYALAMGILLGWPRTLVGVFVAFLVGAVVGLFLLATGKVSWRGRVPFGPFLIVGTLVALIFGNQLWGWYSSFL